MLALSKRVFLLDNGSHAVFALRRELYKSSGMAARFSCKRSLLSTPFHIDLSVSLNLSYHSLRKHPSLLAPSIAPIETETWIQCRLKHTGMSRRISSSLWTFLITTSGAFQLAHPSAQHEISTNSTSSQEADRDFSLSEQPAASNAVTADTKDRKDGERMAPNESPTTLQRITNIEDSSAKWDIALPASFDTVAYHDQIGRSSLDHFQACVTDPFSQYTTVFHQNFGGATSPLSNDSSFNVNNKRNCGSSSTTAASCGEDFLARQDDFASATTLAEQENVEHKLEYVQGAGACENDLVGIGMQFDQYGATDPPIFE
jgi:hypothetical protein